MLATRGKPTLTESITDVFGAKQLQSLVPVQQVDPAEDDLANYGVDLKDLEGSNLRISGYISREGDTPRSNRDNF